MEKIYGYKRTDVIGLANFINATGESLPSKIFEGYAVQTGKAQGTVRNLYYALIKHCKTNKDFCNKYFNGNPPKAESPLSFTCEQEDWLLEKVVSGVESGKSVRSITYELAGGDAKLALRYQNKYRSLLVSKPQKVAALSCKLKKQSPPVSQLIPESLIFKLKKEINGLVEKISQKTKKENDYLRARNTFLQAENIRLNTILYGKPNDFAH